MNSVNSVGGNHSEKAAWVWQGCHTLLHLCKSVLSVGDPSLQEGLCRSVKSVGENHSKKAAWVWQGCHTLLHLCKSVKSVGDPSLQEASVQICEICGRKSQREGSVSSVKSVGGNQLAWLVQLRQLHPLRVSCVGMAGMPYPPTLVLFDEHGGVGGDALHTTGEAELLCSCCLD